MAAAVDNDPCIRCPTEVCHGGDDCDVVGLDTFRGVLGTSASSAARYGLLFDEITAFSLVNIDCDANIIDDPTSLGVNPGGFMIHSAVHLARPDLACVMHSHTAANVAVSCQKGGLLSISQHAMRFHNRVAYHDYDSFAFRYEQREGLQKSQHTRLAGVIGYACAHR